MRTGIFGGTFDPIHQGHLILAEQCREQARLDQVLFIPAARPPHKQGLPLTSFAQRAEMLSLAVAGNPAFRVDSLEKDRPGPSYTVDTLEEVQRREPSHELFLMLGADCLPDLAHWREPVRIVELATLLVVARPGAPPWPSERLQAELHLPAGATLRHQVIQAPLIDIASRDLRRRAAEGRSLRYLVPRSVEAYIQQHGLYAAERAND